MLNNNLEISNDTVAKIAKGLASLIPFTGGIVAEMIPIAIDKRIQKWMYEVENMLNELTQKIDSVQLNSLIQNDEFLSIFLQLTRIAIQTHQQEKLNWLKNSLKNTATNDLNFDLNYTLNSILENLTPHHISILAFFNVHREQLRDQNEYSTFFKNYIELTQTQLKLAYFISYTIDLENKGLLVLSSDVSYSEHHGVWESSFYAVQQNEKQNRSFVNLSEFGYALLKLINDNINI